MTNRKRKRVPKPVEDQGNITPEPEDEVQKVAREAARRFPGVRPEIMKIAIESIRKHSELLHRLAKHGTDDSLEDRD